MAIGIIKGIGINTEASNNLSLSAVIAFGTGCWVFLAIPWFYLEKERLGQMVPDGMNLITAGIRQLIHAMRELLKLRQTFIYLIGFFLLSDSVNTMVQTTVSVLTPQVTVFTTLQNILVSYNTLTSLYLLMVSISAQGLGIGIDLVFVC